MSPGLLPRLNGFDTASLEGEAGLTNPTGPHQGHEARGCEQRMKFLDLTLAANERRDLNRQVVWDRGAI